jgi:hypothetical protein
MPIWVAAPLILSAKPFSAAKLTSKSFEISTRYARDMLARHLLVLCSSMMTAVRRMLKPLLVSSAGTQLASWLSGAKRSSWLHPYRVW